MQSYLYNDDETRNYCDDERYDEEEDVDETSSSKIHGKMFVYPSYDENEDMM